MKEDLITRLRDYRERFIFQGGSVYALQIADEIEHLRAAAQQARAALSYQGWPDATADKLLSDALRALDAALGEKP